MKKRVRRQLGTYHSVPDALDDDYNNTKILTTLTIVECDNGGKVITTEFRDAQRNTGYKIYQVRPEDNLMDIIATVLVEARLK